MLEALVALAALLVGLIGGYFVWLHRFVVSVCVNQAETAAEIKQIHSKVDGIDNAVNHAEQGEKTLRQYVVDMHYRLRAIENTVSPNNDDTNNLSKGSEGTDQLSGNSDSIDFLRSSRSPRGDSTRRS